MESSVRYVCFEKEKCRAAIAVSAIAEKLYRVEDAAQFIEAVQYGDVFEADAQNDGVLIFRRVVKKSNYRKHEYIVSEQYIASTELKAVLKKVDANGGYWEIALGGCVSIFVPSANEYDPTTEICALR